MCKFFLIILLFTVLISQGQTPMRMLVAKRATSSSCGTGSNKYGDSTATSASGSFNTNNIYYIAITVTACGTVTSMSDYIGTTISSGVVVGIYSDNANTPGTLLATSSAKADTASKYNTYTFATKPTVSSSTQYWFASLSTANHLAYYGNTGSVKWMYQSRTYSLGLPATATPLTGGTNFRTGIYITVAH